MSSREPYTPTDDDHLIRYLAKYHPMVQKRLGQKVYMGMCEMTGSEWAWTKRHSWQSWRERYKKNQVRMDAKIAALFKASHKGMTNGNDEAIAEDAPAVKKEVKKVKEVRAKQVEAAVKKEGREPRIEEKQREKDSVRRRSITVTASHSAKTSQEARSSSMMPPPAQRPVRTPKSSLDANAYERSGRGDEHVASDSYDHELFGSQQKDDHTDDGIIHDAESAYTSDEGEETARTRKGTTGSAQKQKQRQTEDTPRAPAPVQPRPSQTQASKSKLVSKKRGKKQEEDIFADTSPSSTPGPPRRPPTAIVRVEEGAFRKTIKRPRESVGDSNWPPKRRKNSITNAAVVQQQEEQKQVKVNGKVNVSHQQVELVIAKPKPQAPPAIASSSRTTLEDMPPPRRPSPPRYRPEANGKTYAARKSDESNQIPNTHTNGNNEVHARARTSDPLPQNTSTRPTENKPPKLDFTELLKSRKSLVNAGLSSRASNISSRSSVASHSRRPSRHQSLDFQAPHLPHQNRPSRPRPSAIELASTQDVNIFAEIGLQHAITLIAQEYGFNTAFTRAIYEQTRDLGYTKFMLRRFQRAVRVEADMLVERFPALLWDNREEEGAQMRMPDVEEFVLSDEEEEDRGKGKVMARKESERRSAGSSVHTSPGSASFSHSRGSSRKKSSGNRSRPRPSQALESVIRPISPNDLLLPDDISDYEPPGKSRAGTFVRLERRGMIDEAIELEKRRVSGQYEKRKSYVDEDLQDQEKNDVDEEEDRMDVDQGQEQEQEYVEDEEYAYQEEEYVDAQDEHEGAQLQEDETQFVEEEEDGQREEHNSDADDEDEDVQGDENGNREGSIISQRELEEEEIDELGQDLFADDEGEYEDGDQRFEGLFTQADYGEGGQDDEDDDEDDMYISQELQPPPAVPEEGEREKTPVIVKIEPTDANISVEAQDEQRDEAEDEDRDEDALVAATRDHCFELSLLVTEDNCEAFKKIEQDMNEYDGDLLKSWSLHWAAERLSRFI